MLDTVCDLQILYGKEDGWEGSRKAGLTTVSYFLAYLNYYYRAK